MNRSCTLKRYQQLYDDLYALHSEIPFDYINRIFEIFLPEYLIYHLRTFDGINSFEQKITIFHILKSILSYFLKLFVQQSSEGPLWLSKVILISPTYLYDQLLCILNSLNLLNGHVDSMTTIKTSKTLNIQGSGYYKRLTKSNFNFGFSSFFILKKFISSGINISSLRLIDYFVAEIYPQKYFAHRLLSRLYFVSRLLSFSSHPFSKCCFESILDSHLISCDPASPYTRFLITILSHGSSSKVSIVQLGQLYLDSIPHEFVFSSAITHNITYYSQSLCLPFDNNRIQLDFPYSHSQISSPPNVLPVCKLINYQFAFGRILFLGTNLSNSNLLFSVLITVKYFLILLNLCFKSFANTNNLTVFVKPHPNSFWLDRLIFRVFSLLSLNMNYVSHHTSIDSFLEQHHNISAVISCDSSAARHPALKTSLQYYY